MRSVARLGLVLALLVAVAPACLLMSPSHAMATGTASMRASGAPTVTMLTCSTATDEVVSQSVTEAQPSLILSVNGDPLPFPQSARLISAGFHALWAGPTRYITPLRI